MAIYITADDTILGDQSYGYLHQPGLPGFQDDSIAAVKVSYMY